MEINSNNVELFVCNIYSKEITNLGKKYSALHLDVLNEKTRERKSLLLSDRTPELCIKINRSCIRKPLWTDTETNSKIKNLICSWLYKSIGATWGVLGVSVLEHSPKMLDFYEKDFVLIKVANQAVLKAVKMAIYRGCSTCGKGSKRFSCSDSLCTLNCDFETYEQGKDMCKDFVIETGIRIGSVIRCETKNTSPTLNSAQIQIVKKNLEENHDIPLTHSTIDIDMPLFGGYDPNKDIKWIYFRTGPIERAEESVGNSYFKETALGTNECDLLNNLQESIEESKSSFIYTCKDPHALKSYILHRMKICGVVPMHFFNDNSSHVSDGFVKKHFTKNYIAFPVFINMLEIGDRRLEIVKYLDRLTTYKYERETSSCQKYHKDSEEEEEEEEDALEIFSPNYPGEVCDPHGTKTLLMDLFNIDQNSIMKTIIFACNITGNGVGEGVRVALKKTTDIDVMVREKLKQFGIDNFYVNEDHVKNRSNIIDGDTGHIRDRGKSYQGGTIERLESGMYTSLFEENENIQEYTQVHKRDVAIIDFASSYSRIYDYLGELRDCDTAGSFLSKAISESDTGSILSCGIRAVNADMLATRERIRKDLNSGVKTTLNIDGVCKIIANASIYGKLGDTRSVYCMKEHAAQITSVGRSQLAFLKNSLLYFFDCGKEKNLLEPARIQYNQRDSLLVAKKCTRREKTSISLLATQTDSVIIAVHSEQDSINTKSSSSSSSSSSLLKKTPLKDLTDFVKYINTSFNGIARVDIKIHHKFINFKDDGSYIALNNDGSFTHSGSYVKTKTTCSACSEIYMNFVEKLLSSNSKYSLNEVHEVYKSFSLDYITEALKQYPVHKFTEILIIDYKDMTRLASVTNNEKHTRMSLLKDFLKGKNIYEGMILCLLRCVKETKLEDAGSNPSAVEIVFSPEESKAMEKHGATCVDYHFYATQLLKQLSKLAYIFEKDTKIYTDSGEAKIEDSGFMQEDDTYYARECSQYHILKFKENKSSVFSGGTIV